MERSFWAWGRADRLPDDGGRRALADRMKDTLGFGAIEELRPIPRVETISLAPPRLSIPADLAGFTSTADDTRVRHTHGRAYPDLVRGFQGRFDSAPDAVATPRSEEDLTRLLEWCTHRRIAAIPYGGGTSVVGGVEAHASDLAAFNGVVTIDLAALDRVLEVDPVSRAARIQAGATGPVLERQLEHEGFTLRHYPQSYEYSTLGGWIATRAGGHYATLRTRIDDFVESIRLLSPEGVYASRRLPSSGAGPSADRLVLGSEGILGVITEAWVRVTKKPAFRSKATVSFRDLLGAAMAARRIVQAGLHPSNCRILDPSEARLNFVAMDGSAVLLLGFESADASTRTHIERAVAIAALEHGVVSKPPVEAETAGQTEESARWREAFFAAPYLQSALVSIGVIADTFETACTWDNFPALHRAVVDNVRAAISRVAGQGEVTCRVTHVYPDGVAPYYTFIAPGRLGAELEQWAEIKRAASDAIIEAGGTITHHHAVGRTHRPWYDRERPELFARALAAAKAAFDPAGVLNPGVLINAAVGPEREATRGPGV